MSSMPLSYHLKMERNGPPAGEAALRAASGSVSNVAALQQSGSIGTPVPRRAAPHGSGSGRRFATHFRRAGRGAWLSRTARSKNKASDEMWGLPGRLASTCEEENQRDAVQYV